MAGTTCRFVAAIVAATALAAALAAGAHAANRVCWGNYDNSTISFANLDGSGAGGQFRRAHSARVRTGRVVSQRPRPGRHLANAAKVNLVVSRG